PGGPGPSPRSRTRSPRASRLGAPGRRRAAAMVALPAAVPDPALPPRRAVDMIATPHGHGLSRPLRAVTPGAGAILGGRGRSRPLGPAVGTGPRRFAAPVLPLVRRRPAEHLLQRAGLPRGARAWESAGPRLGQPGHRERPAVHLRGADRGGGALRRR